MNGWRQSLPGLAWCLVALAPALLSLPNGLRAQDPAVGAGALVGRVLDAGTLEGIPLVEVRVAGTGRVTLTDSRGEYRLEGVLAGALDLQVQRIGYGSETRALVLMAGAVHREEFRLSLTAISLDALVVTATGVQRRRELGNAAPVLQVSAALEGSIPTTASSLLQGRTPGLQVLQSSGTVGGSSTLKIRGNSSISLDNTPIVYLDGARISSDIRSGPEVGGQTTSRLNDLVLDEIESIEVVRGPSAATLYGTEAAAGVLRITTRRGRSGVPQWTLRSEVGSSWDATDWPENVVHLRGLLGGQARDTIYRMSLLEGVGTEQDPWRTGQEVGVGVDLLGGSERATYFVSGGWGDREGALRTNALTRRSFRANLNLLPKDGLSIAVSTGFGAHRVRLPENDNSATGTIGVALFGFPWQLPILRDDPVTGAADVATCPLDYEASQLHRIPLGTVGCAANPFFSGRTFADVETIAHQQRVERFTGSVTVEATPTSQLRARGTVGYDQYSDQVSSFVPVDPALPFGDLSLGYRSSRQALHRNLTLDGVLAWALPVREGVRVTTSVGAQFFREKQERVGTIGRGLPAGTRTVSNAVRTEASEFLAESRTLGLFIEEQLAFGDRFFLTPAIRFDRNSAFGEALGTQSYPRLMASWVLSEEGWFPREGVQSLRLRGAWGRSGKQPSSVAALARYDARRVSFLGTSVAGVSLAWPGNPELRPERGEEVEVGFEADLLAGHLGLDLTWFTQRTFDAIVSRPSAPSTGYPNPRFENIGEVRHSGWEVTLTAMLLHTPALHWDVTANLGTVRGEITRLEEPILFGLGGTTQRHQEGYPYAAYFGRRFTIGEDGAVQGGAEAVYLGQPTPRREGSLATSFGLFGRVLLYANLGFAGGHQLYNTTEEFMCGFLGGGTYGGTCAAIFERDAEGELTEMARIKASAATAGGASPWIEDADFARLRLLAVRVNLPEGWMARVGATAGSLTLAGENLALFTSYSGLDPEVNFAGGSQSTRAEFLTLPPARRIVGRLSITF